MAGYDREVTPSRKRTRDQEGDENLHKRRKANNSEMLLINKDCTLVPSFEIGDDLKNSDIDETPMTPRLKRRFESLFGDSLPTPSMIMKHKMTAAVDKRLEKGPQEKNKCLPSSSSSQLVIASLAADGKEKVASVKQMTPRLKRKLTMLFGDHSDDRPAMKKTKLDDSKALNALVVITDEANAFPIKAFELYEKEQVKLTGLPTISTNHLAKKRCRGVVVPFSQKSKGSSKPDLRFHQMIEEKRKVAAVSVRKVSASKEAIVMRQRHQQRLKTLKLDEHKIDDIKTKGTILYGKSLDWKIPRVPDAADSATALWINETTSPLLGQIEQQPKKWLGWKNPSKTGIDSGDDWSKYG